MKKFPLKNNFNTQQQDQQKPWLMIQIDPWNNTCYGVEQFRKYDTHKGSKYILRHI